MATMTTQKNGNGQVLVVRHKIRYHMGFNKYRALHGPIEPWRKFQAVRLFLNVPLRLVEASSHRHNGICEPGSQDHDSARIFRPHFTSLGKCAQQRKL